MRDAFEAMHIFPKPLSEGFLKSVEEWVATAEEIDEASQTLAAMHAQAEAEVEMEVCSRELARMVTCSIYAQLIFLFPDWFRSNATFQRFTV